MAQLSNYKARLLHEVYNKYWILTQKQIAELREKEEQDLAQFPITDRSLAHHLIGGLYADYVNSVNRLNECYDQICQAQKRILIQRLLESACGRLNELKMEMNNIELSEYIYLDDILVERKLIPRDVELLPPMYTRDWSEEVENAMDPEKRAAKLKEDEEIKIALEEEEKKRKCEAEGIPYIPPGGIVEEEEDEKPMRKRRKKPKEEKQLFVKIDVLTPEQQALKEIEDFFLSAIENIQKHERARKTRMFLYEMERTQILQKQIALGEMKEIPLEVKDKKCIIIQRAWRAYAARKKQKQLIQKEQFLLGSIYPSHYDRSKCQKIKEFQADRRKIRKQYHEEYLKILVQEKERIMLLHAPDIMEDISDHIREWFREWYDFAETFHEYPPLKFGGTILVIRGETVTPAEWLLDKKKTKEQKAKEKEQLKKLKQKEKEKRKKELEKLKQDKLKKKAKGITEYEMKASKMLPILDEAIVEYNVAWKDLDEINNPQQKVYMEPITLDKYAEIHQELRLIVDDMMRLELKLLKKAAEKDRKKKRPKPKKIKGPKAKKPKVPGEKKGKKGKKNKPKKDITADRSYESIIQELIDNGIIVTNYPRATLEDFRGDYSYSAFEKRLVLKDPPPGLCSVRGVVRANCINPLSGDGLGCPRSCLIAGPKQCGKSILVNAILTETESVLFDLNPVNVNKYEGPEGLKMLAHLVIKMAKILQPSVLYIKKCERNFYKKIPPEDKDLDTKRLSKVLLKGIVKQIFPGDRMMLIGTTNEPWNAKGAFKKCYDRIIFIPKPDYGSIYMWYKDKLSARHSVDRTFNPSPLSLVTQDYSLAAIERAINSVLNPRRTITLAVKPLQSEEILEYLQENEQVTTPKDVEKYNKWFKKTNWGKKKARYIKKELKKQELAQKKKVA